MITPVLASIRRLVAGALIVFVVGCTGPGSRLGMVRDSAVSGKSALAHLAEASGSEVALHLNERFGDEKPYCVSSGDNPQWLPALLCSGILMRATRRGTDYDIWNPNPNSTTPNGVPFSWFRKDSGFSRLAYDQTNGFIILPALLANGPADGYTPLTVRCAFPFDGATDGRTGGDHDGCGQYGTLVETGPCQAQGITTAQQWLAKFQNGNLYGNQCGFRLMPGTPGAWSAFNALMDIRDAMPDRFSLHNEVIVGTWEQGDRYIPLEAFFYIDGHSAGLGDAKANQIDFKTRTGRWVPVIRIDMPTEPHGSAGIYFNAADQGIPQ